MKLTTTGRLIALVAVAGISLPACAQLEYSVVLEEDLSGTATMDMAIDMEQMAYIMASMTKAFTGDTTPVNDEELEAAREELLAGMDQDDEWDEEEAMREAQADLPEGVEMLEFSNALDDMRQSFRVRLAFDHISKLNQVRIDPDDATGNASGTPGDEAEPFGGLEVIEEGNTLVLRNDPLEPIQEGAEDASNQVGMEGMQESILSDFSVVFRIEAPFAVLEHNATRRDGDVLIWEYDEDSLEEGAPGVFVRYQR